jgi:hypothetical protein
MMKGLGASGWVLIAMVQSSAALAQLDQAVSDKDLLDPWDRTSAVVLSLPRLLDAVVEPVQRAQIDRGLDRLDEDLSRLRAQLETVAVRIAADPSFSYDVSLKSFEMSTQVAEIGASFEALSNDLSIGERADVRAARESIYGLQQILSRRNPLERDVLRALGSGSRNEIQALAGRWWNAAEAVASLRDAIAQVRARPADASGERRNLTGAALHFVCGFESHRGSGAIHRC